MGYSELSVLIHKEQLEPAAGRRLSGTEEEEEVLMPEKHGNQAEAEGKINLGVWC